MLERPLPEYLFSVHNAELGREYSLNIIHWILFTEYYSVTYQVLLQWQLFQADIHVPFAKPTKQKKNHLVGQIGHH